MLFLRVLRTSSSSNLRAARSSIELVNRTFEQAMSSDTPITRESLRKGSKVTEQECRKPGNEFAGWAHKSNLLLVSSLPAFLNYSSETHKRCCGSHGRFRSTQNTASLVSVRKAVQVYGGLTKPLPSAGNSSHKDEQFDGGQARRSVVIRVDECSCPLLPCVLCVSVVQNLH
jgi:hypothetical protein